jgi:electron transport complex protein RnfG
MSNKLDFKGILRPALALTLICIVTSLALALTNSFTKDPIDKIKRDKQNAAKFEVFEAADDFTDKEATDDSGNTFTYSEALDDSGQVIGYVFQNASPGYHDNVTVITSVDLDGVILSAKAIDHQETPNIGSKIVDDPSFAQGFSGKVGQLSFSSDGAGESQVQSISGATKSSTAFLNAVNQSMAQYEIVKGGE